MLLPVHSTTDWSIMVGPTWEDRYTYDPEFAHRYDKAMDKADEELAEYFKTPKGKFDLYIIFIPLMVLASVIVSITGPIESLVQRFRDRKSK